MKSIAILLFVCAVGIFAKPIDEDNSKEEESFKKCIKVYNITREEADKLPLETAFYLVTICTMRHVGAFNDDGTINEAYILPHKKEDVSDEKVHAVLEKCNSVFVDRKNLQEEIKYINCLEKEKLPDLINPITLSK